MSIYLRIEGEGKRAKLLRLREPYHEICLDADQNIGADSRGAKLLAIASHRSGYFISEFEQLHDSPQAHTARNWRRLPFASELSLKECKVKIVNTDPKVEVMVGTKVKGGPSRYMLDLLLGSYCRSIPVPGNVPIYVGKDETCHGLIKIEGVSKKHCMIYDQGGALALKPLQGRLELNGESWEVGAKLLPKAGGEFHLLPSGLKCQIRPHSSSSQI